MYTQAMDTAPKEERAVIRNADEVVAEAREDAQKIVTEARVEAEKLESETKSRTDKLEQDARTRAQNLDSETDTRRREVLGEIEQEKDRLDAEIENLRSFEREYRSRLKSYFSQQLQALDGNGEGGDLPVPSEEAPVEAQHADQHDSDQAQG